jgi:hypothetical protein
VRDRLVVVEIHEVRASAHDVDLERRNHGTAVAPRPGRSPAAAAEPLNWHDPRGRAD